MRYSALVVALEKDYSEEEIQTLLTAIKQMRFVLDVTPQKVQLEEYVAERRVHTALSIALWNVLYPKKESDHG